MERSQLALAGEQGPDAGGRSEHRRYGPGWGSIRGAHAPEWGEASLEEGGGRRGHRERGRDLGLFGLDLWGS